MNTKQRLAEIFASHYIALYQRHTYLHWRIAVWGLLFSQLSRILVDIPGFILLLVVLLLGLRKHYNDSLQASEKIVIDILSDNRFLEFFKDILDAQSNDKTES